MEPQTAIAAARLGPPVIQGKLQVPALPRQHVARPRLERMLAALVQSHRVVVVSATAGAGKTTAVARAAGWLDRPVAWLTVDRTDTAPGRLVTYLEAALIRVLPQIEAVATAAVAGGVPHAEAAGLLAEAAGETPVVLVVDDLERLGVDESAWAVIEAVVRYCGPNMRLVLVSRREIPAGVLGNPIGETVAVAGDEELAFTVPEAAEALACVATAPVDAARAVQATGGWVTGVLFEAWRSSGHVPGRGGESDPLHGYLATHILEQLAPCDRDFLVRTALLDEVTASRAQALGELDASQRLDALRAAHVPVRWERGDALRCHPRFQEYLLACLERRGAAELRALRVAHGRLLAEEGYDEEATEELIRAGAPEEALGTAARAIIPVIERLDFPVADRWLSALAGSASGGSSLPIAEMMLAHAQDDVSRAVRIADRLAAAGEREPLAASSSRAAALMAWSYLLQVRLEDVRAIVAVVEEGRLVDVLRYAWRSSSPDLPPTARSSQAIRSTRSRWPATSPTAGSIESSARARPGGSTPFQAHGASPPCARWDARPRTLELYARARAKGQAGVQLEAWAGPEVLIDAGRASEARDAVARGRGLAKLSGSLVHEFQTFPPDAKLALRLEHDPLRARATLDQVERHRAVYPCLWVFELVDTWYGLALLREGANEAARGRLRRAVQGMVLGDRMLELPTAAVYLAEAEWRAGDDEAADQAADLALWAAGRLGSNHILLQALADYPVVVSRRLDAEPSADSPARPRSRADGAAHSARAVRWPGRRAEGVRQGADARRRPGGTTPDRKVLRVARLSDRARWGGRPAVGDARRPVRRARRRVDAGIRPAGVASASERVAGRRRPRGRARSGATRRPDPGHQRIDALRGADRRGLAPVRRSSAGGDRGGARDIRAGRISAWCQFGVG